MPSVSRRHMLGAAAAALSGPAGTPAPAAAHAPPPLRFRISLNTSTIRGQKVPLLQEIDLAAKAGYDAIEPWMNELDQHRQGGGSTAEVRSRLADRGLAVESVIGFFPWIVDDDAARAKGLEEAKRAMGLVAEIGGRRLAAPPVGATDRADLDLRRIAERYRALLEVGDRMGVVPQAEVWGFSRTLTRLSDAAFIAVQADHPQACVLADVYHLHKGGSGFAGLRQLSGLSMHVFHVNDYPADPPPTQITDAHRVYPGDGVAPLTGVFRALREVGFNGILSLELFNRDYWQQDALHVAATGLKKTRAAIERAFA